MVVRSKISDFGHDRTCHEVLVPYNNFYCGMYIPLCDDNEVRQQI